MSVTSQGGWTGYTSDLPRRRRPMSEDRRAAFEALLAKKRLEPYERGQLRALARDGSQLDQERAQAKLGPGGGGRGSLVDKDTLAAMQRGISAALDRESDW